MTREEAITIINHRFDASSNDPWWHQENGDIYVKLFNQLEPVIGVRAALAILSAAYAAAADEYGD